MHKNKIFIIPNPISHPKIRLFCFPFAGGGAYTFYPWVSKLNDSVELVLIEPPGRGSRISEPPHQTMKALVNEIMQHSEFITQIPYVFFGHSLGSRVAFELSCQLKNLGKSMPEYFIASGSRAPHLPNEKGITYNLPQQEFIQELKSLNGTPKDVLSNSDLMDLLIPILRADFKIAETYQAQEVKMPYPILVLHGKEDSGIKPHQLAAWGELSSMGYLLSQLPGDHFFINQFRSEVIAHVSDVLSRVFNLIIYNKATSIHAIQEL